MASVALTYIMPTRAKANTVNVEAHTSFPGLHDLLPMIGPAGTTAICVTPTGLIGATNAVDSAAVDFVDPISNLTTAVVFATLTKDRVYDHSFHLCNRFHDYRLESAAAVPLMDLNPNSSGPSWFWHAATTKANLVEEAIVLVAYIDDLAGTVTVDSQWMSDDYKAAPGQSIVAFQIWAELALG